MDRLDVDGEVRRQVPRGSQGCDRVTGCERCCSTVVDVDPIRCRRWELTPVQCGEDPCDDRPGMRVGGCFACEVTGFELGKGGVDVLEVEYGTCHDTSVAIDLGDVEYVRSKCQR